MATVIEFYPVTDDGLYGPIRTLARFLSKSAAEQYIRETRRPYHLGSKTTITVYDSAKEAHEVDLNERKSIALAKLTADERKLLGL